MQVTHLASYLLGAVARRIDDDWQERYGHRVDWLETFVDRERFPGSCYRSANWECVWDRPKDVAVRIATMLCEFRSRMCIYTR